MDQPVWFSGLQNLINYIYKLKKNKMFQVERETWIHKFFFCLSKNRHTLLDDLYIWMLFYVMMMMMTKAIGNGRVVCWFQKKKKSTRANIITLCVCVMNLVCFLRIIIIIIKFENVRLVSRKQKKKANIFVLFLIAQLCGQYISISRILFFLLLYINPEQY